MRCIDEENSKIVVKMYLALAPHICSDGLSPLRLINLDLDLEVAL